MSGRFGHIHDGEEKIAQYKALFAEANDPENFLHAERVVSEQMAFWREVGAVLNAEIARRYTDAAKLAFEKAGKADGKVTVDLPGDIQLAASVSKRVAWDKDKLKAAASKMPWADVQHYFKIDFDVSENIYKAVPPSSEFKQVLDEARTVTRGDIKITLKRKDAAPEAHASGG